MKAKISRKEEIAKGTLLVTFDLLGSKIDFKAGQYFFITIPKLLYSDDKGNIRHFSIVNSPNENNVITMATRIREESGFKKTLRDLPIGSLVEIGSVQGDFTLSKIKTNNLVLIAGGIGITPFMGMLKYVQEESLPYDITLIYSNRDKQSSAFLDELNELKNKNPNLKIVLIMTQDPSWTGESKRVDVQFIADKLPDFKNKTFYISGPPIFNQAISEVLKKLKIERRNILVENFIGY
jgi:ferredoxin-NADP reductase